MGSLAFDPPQVSTLGVFTPGSVKLKEKVLTITGTRSTLIIDKMKPALSGTVSMSLIIYLGADDPSIILPRLQESLFFADLKSAVDSLPPWLRAVVPYVTDPPKQQGLTPWILRDGEWSRISGDSNNVKMPKPLHEVAPEFTGQARSQKMRGAVTLAFVVTEHGAVDSVWLVNPIGLGLDESAAKAASQYTFEPAQVDGKPVGVLICMEINFQVD